MTFLFALLHCDSLPSVGHVQSIKFSYDRKILAIQRSLKVVVRTLFNQMWSIMLYCAVQRNTCVSLPNLGESLVDYSLEFLKANPFKEQADLTGIS